MTAEYDKPFDQLKTLDEKIAFCAQRLSEEEAKLKSVDGYVADELKKVDGSEADRKAITPTINDEQQRRSEKIDWLKKRLAELRAQHQELLDKGQSQTEV